MPMIDVRDTRLYYEMEGEGEPALLFIHGMCGAAWNWEDQMNRLSSEFTCVAYDRRGHGGSEGAPEDQSDRTHTDDAATLIDALSLDRPVVVGASSGAIIATELVRRHSKLVSGAVLIEPPLLGLDPEAGQALMAELGPPVENALASGGPRAAVDVVLQAICSSFWAQIDEDTRNRIRDNAAVLMPTLLREAADITPDDLAGIDLPILLMEGAKTHPVHRSINRALTTHLPNARFVEIAESGHLIFAEKPAEFAQAVRAFAREIVDRVPTTSSS